MRHAVKRSVLAATFAAGTLALAQQSHPAACAKWGLPRGMRRAQWSGGRPQASPGVPRQTFGLLRQRGAPSGVRWPKWGGGRPQAILIRRTRLVGSRSGQS
jgi:hypothetical protein